MSYSTKECWYGQAPLGLSVRDSARIGSNILIRLTGWRGRAFQAIAPADGAQTGILLVFGQMCMRFYDFAIRACGLGGSGNQLLGSINACGQGKTCSRCEAGSGHAAHQFAHLNHGQIEGFFDLVDFCGNGAGGFNTLVQHVTLRTPGEADAYW